MSSQSSPFITKLERWLRDHADHQRSSQAERGETWKIGTLSVSVNTPLIEPFSDPILEFFDLGV